MYHSIGVVNPYWNWNYLTCPYDRFEAQLRAIKELRLTTISLNTLYEYMVNGKTIPKRSIALTFDDGYADIWIYAYPLLKKYNMCGTVFINPEFVDPRENTNECYSLDKTTAHLGKSGYLSWKEIIQMDGEGVVFAESHALTHTWYPIANEVIDFRHPKDTYTWMTWNEHTDLKYKLQIDDPNLKRLGQPVYKHEKSLMRKRYYPDSNLDLFLQEFVLKNGGSQFFNHLDYREILFQEVQNFVKKNKLQDRYETNEEFERRIRHELEFTKSILEEKLNRKITFLCWPGGSATKIGMKIAKELGYTFFNSARDMTNEERKEIKNIWNGGNRVSRFTPLIYFNGEENLNSKIVYANRFWMKLQIYRSKNTFVSKVIFKLFINSVNLVYIFLMKKIKYEN
jgi:hypothetical protein